MARGTKGMRIQGITAAATAITLSTSNSVWNSKHSDRASLLPELQRTVPTPGSRSITVPMLTLKMPAQGSECFRHLWTPSLAGPLKHEPGLRFPNHYAKSLVYFYFSLFSPFSAFSNVTEFPVVIPASSMVTGPRPQWMETNTLPSSWNGKSKKFKGAKFKGTFQQYTNSCWLGKYFLS